MTEAEWKTLVIGELGAESYQSQIDALWDSWWSLEGPGVNSDATIMELRLKRRILGYLAGQYRTRYNVTVGTEKREAGVLLRNTLMLLDRINSDISEVSPSAGVPTLRTTRFTIGTLCEQIPEPGKSGGWG